ncbi:hypothetical protein CEXT_797701, partial [Caerostris extrusa]
MKIFRRQRWCQILRFARCKEDDKNACLTKSVDSLITVGRIVCRTREMHKQYNAQMSEVSEETLLSE